MPRRTRAQDPRARVRDIGLSLPEATAREINHIKFEVRGKTFGYYLDNHHGDGRIAINCKVAPGDQDLLLRVDPVRFFMPAYLGPKGWVGFRLDTPDVDWEHVRQLLTDSYRLVAPKRLAAAVR